MRDFLDAIQCTNVVKSVDGRRKPAVQTEDLVVDESGQGEVVKEIGEGFPDVGIAIFAQAFIVKPIDLGDLA